MPDDSLDRQFNALFRALTGNDPFPWQEALFREFLECRFPTPGRIPTGLGKTSTIAVWLLALACLARKGMPAGYPRRLVYVVNRRTVVDQATAEVEKMRAALVGPDLSAVAKALASLSTVPSANPLAVSTMRGQFAESAEWRMDPARPAVVVGTIDLIGSRLLFSGYRSGFKSRPLYAGFLGQDVLLVHDEAHLEHPFQVLLESIVREQHRSGDGRPMRVIALSATSRTKGGDGDDAGFRLTSRDLENEEVSRRYRAKKSLVLTPIDDSKRTAEEVARLALAHEGSDAAVLVFLDRLADVGKVQKALPRGRVELLTGTQRGLERDAMTSSSTVFARFVPNLSRERPVCAGTVYLVTTSAGEIGINITADHAVCDLVPFDRMAQRLGRVNRFGRGAARVDVVHSVTFQEADDPRETPRARTLDLLRKLPPGSDGSLVGSPAALDGLPPEERAAAFTPLPRILDATDILFDVWSLTSVRSRQGLPGRPPVEAWLHGEAEWEPPQTHVAWRLEVEVMAGDLLQVYDPDELIEAYPLKPDELLRDRTDRVFEHVKKLAARDPAAVVWLFDDDGKSSPKSLGDVVEEDLAGATLLLPPRIGGLRFPEGVFDGSEPFQSDRAALYDVADRWEVEGIRQRQRLWSEPGSDEAPTPKGMRIVFNIQVPRGPGGPEAPEDDEDLEAPRQWRWYVRPRSSDDDASRATVAEQLLGEHLSRAESNAVAMGDRLALGEIEATALRFAARHHDLGKKRSIWQRSIGNLDPAKVLAKSGNRLPPVEPTRYRHELGSLIDAVSSAAAEALAPAARELALHFIAAHHGRGRPHFPAAEIFDPERPDDDAAATASEASRRFARLQRRYGRWGLAWLESLLRAVDALASLPGDRTATDEAGSRGAEVAGSGAARAR